MFGDWMEYFLKYVQKQRELDTKKKLAISLLAIDYASVFFLTKRKIFGSGPYTYSFRLLFCNVSNWKIHLGFTGYHSGQTQFPQPNDVKKIFHKFDFILLMIRILYHVIGFSSIFNWICFALFMPNVSTVMVSSS